MKSVNVLQAYDFSSERIYLLILEFILLDMQLICQDEYAGFNKKGYCLFSGICLYFFQAIGPDLLLNFSTPNIARNNVAERKAVTVP